MSSYNKAQKHEGANQTYEEQNSFEGHRTLHRPSRQGTGCLSIARCSDALCPRLLMEWNRGLWLLNNTGHLMMSIAALPNLCGGLRSIHTASPLAAISAGSRHSSQMHRGPLWATQKEILKIRHSTGSSARLSGTFLPVLACSCWVHGVPSGGLLVSYFTGPFQGSAMWPPSCRGARCSSLSELQHPFICSKDWPASLCWQHC